MEGGIRDIFDLGAHAESLAGGVQLAAPDGVRSFEDFLAIPPLQGQWGKDTFDPFRIDVGALGRNTFLAWGSANPSASALRSGDGDHVGTPEQTYDRFLVFFRWLSSRWDAISPAAPVNGVGNTEVFHYASRSLGAEVDFAVSLPPRYAQNAPRRYPVLYLLHGYGQTAQDFSGTSIFVNTLSNLGNMREIIVVYPSGRCCLTGPRGERACRDQDDAGTDYTSLGYVRECARGNFFVDRAGYSNGDRTPYGAALLELMDEIDKRYRTLSPADGPAF
jgi:hypothetical protein